MSYKSHLSYLSYLFVAILFATLFFVAPPAHAASFMSSGLVGYWKMDEGSGTTSTDSSGNGNNGTLGSKTTWTAGKIGGALKFNGVQSNYVNVTTNSGLPIYNQINYSVSMWVNGPPNQANGNLFSEASSTSANPMFVLANQGGADAKLDVLIRNNSGVAQLGHAKSTATVFDNKWHHIVWTDSNGTAKLYVDGVQDATNFNYTRSTLSINTTSIGHLNRGADEYNFNGSLDDVRIYNRALSAGEITQLYRLGLTEGSR